MEWGGQWVKTQGRSRENRARREWGTESSSRATKVVFTRHSGAPQGVLTHCQQQASSSLSKHLVYPHLPDFAHAMSSMWNNSLSIFSFSSGSVPSFNQQTFINIYGRPSTVLDIRDVECNKSLVKISCAYYCHHYNYS